MGEIIILYLTMTPRAVSKVSKRQSGSSNTAADCNFSKGIKAEMCLWDNLGNSTDLHWQASIGQVSRITKMKSHLFSCVGRLLERWTPCGQD